jgi:hypothetical protein
MKASCSILCILFLYSCQSSTELPKKKSYTSLELTYLLLLRHEFFSIKLTDSDTCYIQQYYPSDINGLPEGTYYSVLKKLDRKGLDSILNRIDFNQYDSIYNEQGYFDGDTFQINFQNDSVNKTIYVHSMFEPKKLHELKECILNLKKQIKYIQIDTPFKFITAQRFLSPLNTSDSPVKLIPPK